jgi:glutaredoxin 3
MPASVIIYTTEYCPYCVRAKSLLEKKGASYEEIDVGDRPDLRSWLIETSKQRTVPQVFINGVPVGGFTDIAELDRKGALTRLLSEDPGGSAASVRR